MEYKMRCLILAFGLMVAFVSATHAAPCQIKTNWSGKTLIAASSCSKTEVAQARADLKTLTAPRYDLKREIKVEAQKGEQVYRFLCGSKGRPSQKAFLRCYDRKQGNSLAQAQLEDASLRALTWKSCRRYSGKDFLGCVSLQKEMHRDVFAAVESYLADRKARKVAKARLLQLQGCKEWEGRVKCGSLGWAAWLLTLLCSRRKSKESWYEPVEAIAVQEVRMAIWRIEDWGHRLSFWVERPIEAWMALVAFTPFGIFLSLASAWLGKKRYGWASMAALLLSVCLYGSGVEWGLFLIKVGICFLTETNEGEDLLARYLKWRWLRSVS
jgi:hypothetical protein